MPTLQELFRDRAALDLALHELLSVCPMDLRLAMVTEPRDPIAIATLKAMRRRHPEIGELPTIVFRAGLAAAVISRALHALLEEGGEDAVLQLADDGTLTINGPTIRGPVMRPATTVTRVLVAALVISEVNADALWRSFVHLMRDHYHRPTFFRLRVERGGTMRLLRPTSAAAQPSNT